MTKTNQEIERICKKLLSGEIYSKALSVSLDEFQRFYSTFVNLARKSPKVSLVNLEDIVIAQFSDIAPQHFDISDTKPLVDNDFAFIQYRRWYGATNTPERFTLFIWKELRQNLLKLLMVAIISFTILFLANSTSLYELMISLLIQSSTVFLSLYIIFTVSQSQGLYSDLELFKSGVLHKYYRDDRNVTLLGIVTVSSTFLSAGLIYLLSEYNPNIYLQAAKAALVTVNITLLFDTFLTVANYYLERNRDIIERNIAADILNDDFLSNDKKP